MTTAAAPREAGFTLVELLVTMAMMSVVLGGLVAFMTSTIRWNGEVQDETTLQAEVRGFADRMAQELRSAYVGPATAAITTLSPNQITFDTPDRGTPFHVMQVSYRVSSLELDRAFATSTNTNGPPWTIPALGPWIQLFKPVTSANPFTYYDANGVATTTPANVRTVGISISVSPGAAQGRQFTYKTTVDLRNGQ